jgi:hypothetical protein
MAAGLNQMDIRDALKPGSDLSPHMLIGMKDEADHGSI